MPVQSAVSAAAGLLREVLEQPVEALAPEAVDECLRELHALTKLAHAAQLRLIRVAQEQGLAERAGARNVKSWLQDALNLSGGDAASRVRLAETAADGGPLAEALRTGSVSLEHARVIRECVSKLPAGLDDSQRLAAETWLVEQAQMTGPHDLRVLGDKLRCDLDPDGALRDEEYFRETRELHFGTSRDGAFVGRWRCDQELGAKIAAVLEPLAKPRPANDDTPDPRSPAQRRMDALASALDLAMGAPEMPTVGGERSRLVVTIPYDTLARRANDAGVFAATGEPVSPATARRLACDAGVLPVVLGGNSVPLDAGREERTASPQLRAVLLARDGTCAFPGCDRPPGTPEAHHCIPWAEGGPTSIDNLVMLCGGHHRLLHARGWQARINEYGRPEFVPPASVDPQRTPRPGGKPAYQPPADLRDTG